MKVTPIPCLNDNYAYLIVCEDTGQAAIVDPSEAPPVLERVRREKVALAAILNTHHHGDHTGGNQGLLEKFPQLTVCGHASDSARIPGINQPLEAGQPFAVGNLKGSVLHNPGHTSGGLSYVIEDCVFTGDTLFAAGCGRLFEGTPAMMYKSLNQTIGGLPEQTRVFFGHEYTETNLRFAQTVEPQNEAVRERLAKVRELRKKGEFSTPSRLSEEWRTNPFMRCGEQEVIARAKKEDPANDLSPVSVLGAVRRMKDSF